MFVIGEAEGCKPWASLLRDDGMTFPDNVAINPKEESVLCHTLAVPQVSQKELCSHITT